MNEYEQHIISYHQRSSIRHVRIPAHLEGRVEPAFTGSEPDRAQFAEVDGAKIGAEQVHLWDYAGCTWEPGMCLGEGPHSGWWCCSPGPQGPDAVYQCRWCTYQALGREIKALWPASATVAGAPVLVTADRAVTELKALKLTDTQAMALLDRADLASEWSEERLPADQRVRITVRSDRQGGYEILCYPAEEE